MNFLKQMDTRKRAKVSLIIICLVLYFQTMSNSLIAYIMQSYSNIDPTMVRQILTIPGMVGLFVSFAVGPISLKINKKYLTIFITLCAFTYFMIFASVGANGPFSLLVVGAVIMGFSQGSSRTLTTSMIAEFVETEKKASFVALTTALMNGGGAVMNVIGGNIAAGNGGADWPKAYLLGIIILPALLIFIVMMPKNPGRDIANAAANAPGSTVRPDDANDSEESAGKFIPPRVLIVVLLNSLFAISVTAFMYNFSEYIIITHKLGTSAEAGTTNFLYLIVGLVVGVIYPFFMKIFKRFIAPVGYAIFALGMLMMITIHTSMVFVYISTILIGLGFNVGNPFVSAYAMQITPKKWIPVTMSLLFGGVNLGMSLSIPLLSFLSGLIGGGVQNTLIIGCIGGAVSTVCAVFLYAMDPRTKIVVGEKKEE